MCNTETAVADAPPASIVPVYIRVGQGDGNGAYAWTHVRLGTQGEWVDGDVRGSLTSWPAYEANCGPHVSPGFIVRAIAYPGIEELRFFAPNQTVAPQPAPPVVGPAVVGETIYGDQFPVRIADGDGSGMYAWREQIPTSGGGWADGERQGTSHDWPARELGSNTRVSSGLVVMANVDRDNLMLHIQVGEV